MLTGGLGALSQEQRQTMFARQNPDIRAAMSTTTSTEGGFTVATEFSRTLLEAMRQMGGVRAVANNIRTATGAQMLFPTADATQEEGEIVGQNATTNEQDTVFGQASMDVYKYSSKSIALPFELLQDSMIDIEAYVQNLLKLRLWRIQNRHQTLGTGTGQPAVWLWRRPLARLARRVRPPPSPMTTWWIWSTASTPSIALPAA